MNHLPRERLLKAALFLGALAPFLVLLWDAFTGGLGADPVKAITHRTGWWTLALLLATLAVTPLRRITGYNRLVQQRRMLGLFAFLYASLHLLTYVVLDQTLDLSYVGEDIAKRPYITIGFAAWLLLVPLAVTSTKGWIRRLGKGWMRLHRLVYLVAALGATHFYWQVKKDVREPLIFAGILVVLLAFRAIPRRTQRSSPAPVTPAA